MWKAQEVLIGKVTVLLGSWASGRLRRDRGSDLSSPVGTPVPRRGVLICLRQDMAAAEEQLKTIKTLVHAAWRWPDIDKRDLI